MYNIGLDFGTTYSGIAYVADGKPVSFTSGQYGVAFTPSFVTFDPDYGKYAFGRYARECFDESSHAFDCFKMLLAESDLDLLQKRGYEPIEWTKSKIFPDSMPLSPAYIAREYLQWLIEEYFREKKLKKIDELVVGVPEIWFNETKTIDAKDTLSQILLDIGEGRIGKVTTVSEPACACAFYIDAYYKSSNVNFNGNILIVDFGGGTLDIALCEVKQDEDALEVYVRERTGTGINVDSRVGTAGVAFLEEVVRLATNNVNIPLVDKQKLMDKLENALIEKKHEIDDYYSANEGSDLDLNNEFFIRLPGKYKVSYSTLAKAFNNVIRSSLVSELDRMKELLNRRQIDYLDKKCKGDFKLALAGGFTNFYLTRSCIMKAFGGQALNDTRFSGMQFESGSTREAIMYGAALIADGKIRFRKTCPYTLGFAPNRLKEGEQIDMDSAYKVDPDDRKWIAMQKGDDYTNEPSFIKWPNGKPRVFLRDQVPLFLFNITGNPNDYLCALPHECFHELMKLDKSLYYHLGLSLDVYERITLHLECSPDLNFKKHIQTETRTLDSFQKLFHFYTVRTGDEGVES